MKSPSTRAHPRGPLGPLARALPLLLWLPLVASTARCSQADDGADPGAVAGSSGASTAGAAGAAGAGAAGASGSATGGKSGAGGGTACWDRTRDEKQCKDCCDCDASLGCEERVACRDTCITFDASHWAALAGAPSVEAPSKLGPGGDYGACTSAATEQACKACCECTGGLSCGDFRFCRDACKSVLGAGGGGSGGGALDGAAVSQGSVPAEMEAPGSCTPTEDVYRAGSVGSVKVGDQTFVVPAPLSAAPVCPDLYNPCAGGQQPPPGDEATFVVDDTPDAQVVSIYVYADNDFELAVGGKVVCRDALHFTPFNSHVARVKVKLPTALAIHAVDWEESLGVGVEKGTKLGDAGLVARAVDASGKTLLATSEAWRCQVFYAAPFDDVACVKAGRDTSACPAQPACPADGDTADCKALHWPIPPDWASASFDASSWPAAVVYPAAEVGPKTAYTANAALFDAASFIWTRNIVLDNRVICRATLAP